MNLLDEDDYLDSIDRVEAMLKLFVQNYGELLGSIKVRTKPFDRLRNEVYLKEAVCPPGTAPCNEDDCPAEGLNIFTSTGDECYDMLEVQQAARSRFNKLQAKAKKQKSLALDTRSVTMAARDLTSMVSAVAQLSSRLQGIGNANIDCEAVDNLSKTEEAKQAFCGSLFNADKSRRCVFKDNKCSPVQVESPASPKPMKGGAAVAAGTYGCVFKPGVPCKGDVDGVKSGKYTNTVSKIMLPDDAKADFEESESVRRLQSTLPQAMQDYLLIALQPPCDVAFKPADVLDAPQICQNLPSRVRMNLILNAREVKSVLQRDGGRSISALISRYFDEPTFLKMNTGIMEITDVIRQIGLRGGIHGDIKADNLVFNYVDNKVRIIDWGFFKYLNTDYEGTRWKEFEVQPPVMYNEMLSTWLYSVEPTLLPASTTPVDELIAWAHSNIKAWLDQQDISHAQTLDDMETACSEAASRLGGSAFKVPVPGPHHAFSGLSLRLTNLFVAHAVALLSAGFAERRAFFIDTVLRLNQDIFGALTAYCTPLMSRMPQAVSDRALYTVGRFLWDPKYAVEPYDLKELKAAFSLLATSDDIVRPFPAPLTPDANLTIMAALDPDNLRAFNPANYDVARGKTDPNYVNQQVTDAMKPALAAGAAVAAGTYGCVFQPGIPCEGDRVGVASGAYNNTVSKIMMPHDAKEEYDESQHVRWLQGTLPLAMQDYLLVSLRPPCSVVFTPADVTNASRVCTNLPPRISGDLIANAAQVRSITQRDGGRSIHSLFRMFDKPTFVNITAGIMQLTDIIRQMGLRGGIHGDIKAENLVFNPVDNKVRIIDWGFFKYLDSDYLHTRWDSFSSHPPVMFNGMLSTWLYSIDVARIPASSSPVETLVQWAHTNIGLWLSTQNIGHAKQLDLMVASCSRAAARLGASPFDIPVVAPFGGTLVPFSGLSLTITNLFVAHAVALLSAGFAERPKFFIDTVLRLNQDIYGALTSFVSSSVINLAPKPPIVYLALYTAGRYLWDPKYAVEPYDLGEMKTSFAAVINSDNVVRPFPAALQPSANVAVMAALDPDNLRAFNPATYDVARGKVDESYVKAEVWNAMKPRAAAATSSSKRTAEEPAAAPAATKFAPTAAPVAAPSPGFTFSIGTAAPKPSMRRQSRPPVPAPSVYTTTAATAAAPMPVPVPVVRRPAPAPAPAPAPEPAKSKWTWAAPYDPDPYATPKGDVTMVESQPSCSIQ